MTMLPKHRLVSSQPDRCLAHPKLGLELGARVQLGALERDIWLAKRWAALHEAVAQSIYAPECELGSVVGVGTADSEEISAVLLVHRATVVFGAGSGVQRTPGRDRTRAVSQAIVEFVAPPPSPDSGSAFGKIAIKYTPGLGTTIAAAAYLALDTAGTTILDAVIAVSGVHPSPGRFDLAATRLTGAPATRPSYDMAACEIAHAVVDAQDLASDRVLYRDIAELLTDVLAAASRRARSKNNPFEDASALLADHPIPLATTHEGASRVPYQP
jgi:CO/xanthine dehydrogenase FAD-binding subunit